MPPTVQDPRSVRAFRIQAYPTRQGSLLLVSGEVALAAAPLLRTAAHGGASACGG